MPEIFRPSGEKPLETLREMYIARNQARIEMEGGLSVDDAKKILRALQMETLKSKLRSSKRNHVSYDEFIQMCVDGCCSNKDQGAELAKVLDSSCSVIVLGNVVFLKPEQVVKAINGLMVEDNLFQTQL